MSSIASSPGITSGPIIETAALRALDSSDSRPAPQNGTPAAASAAVAATSALDPGPAPIDQDRVATIRKAIADNDYPVVPTKIGDAMIAAGMLLRMAK